MQCKLWIRSVNVETRTLCHTTVVCELRCTDGDDRATGEITLCLQGNHLARFREHLGLQQHDWSETFDIPLPEVAP